MLGTNMVRLNLNGSFPWGSLNFSVMILVTKQVINFPTNKAIFTLRNEKIQSFSSEILKMFENVKNQSQIYVH